MPDEADRSTLERWQSSRPLPRSKSTSAQRLRTNWAWRKVRVGSGQTATVSWRPPVKAWTCTCTQGEPCLSTQRRLRGGPAASGKCSIIGDADVVFSGVARDDVTTLAKVGARRPCLTTMFTVGRLSELSDRECLVATKFAQGMTHREIGEALFIASSTVRTHLAAIYRKLGIHNKAALANLFAAFQPPTSASVSFAENHYDGRGRPVVLVLPFENLSADERWTRIAEGFSADLMVDLARYPDLAVVALQTLLSANGSATGGEGLRADYLLEGSLQAVGSRVRVCVRLADALNGVSLWAIRSDRSTEDLLSVQDGVVESVINALAGCEGKLANHRREAIRGRPPADLGAYDCYLLGAEQNRQRQPGRKPGRDTASIDGGRTGSGIRASLGGVGRRSFRGGM